MASGYRVSYIDSFDPQDVHGLLVWHFDDPPMMKLKTTKIGNETVSFFYCRVPGMLMTAAERYIVVAIMNNTDPLFSDRYRRLSELHGWISFQTRTFDRTDLPLEPTQIVQHEYTPKAARETGLQQIRLHIQQRSKDRCTYSCSTGSAALSGIKATLLPSNDRVELAKSGSLRDGLETFQCVLERF